MSFHEPTEPVGAKTPDLESAVYRTQKVHQIHAMLAELDEWSRANMKELADQDELHRKMYETRLPIVLFHATTKEHAKSIMLQGLLPHQLEFAHEEVVSLSDTIAYARMCASVTQNTPEDELVVFEVTTQGIDRDQAKSFLHIPPPGFPDAEMHEVHYLEPINSDWIHQLTPEEVAEIVVKEK